MSTLSAFIDHLSEAAPRIDAQTLREILERHPDTALAFGLEAIEQAVRAADERLIDGLRSRDIEAAASAIAPLAAELGSQFSQAGNTIEPMLESIRIYQHTSWDVASGLAVELGLAPELVTEIAHAYIGFANSYTSAAVDGYLAAAAERNAARLVARRQLLVELLTAPVDFTSLEAKAAACEWAPPATVRVAVATTSSPTWPGDALSGAVSGLDVAVCSADTRHDADAAYGPAVDLAEARESFAIARRLAHSVPPGASAMWEDHLALLAVTGDPRSAAELSTRMLGPLERANARQRGWLEPTLWAWLDHRGSITRIAQALHLHEQSARYRVERLRELYGAALDKPQFRFELRLALEIRAIRNSPTSARAAPRPKS